MASTRPEEYQAMVYRRGAACVYYLSVFELPQKSETAQCVSRRLILGDNVIQGFKEACKSQVRA